MTFQQALRMLEMGEVVNRNGVVIGLGSGSMAVLATALMGSATPMVDLGGYGNWITLRIPLIREVPAGEPWISGIGYPYIFSDEDKAATDWELGS